MWACTIYDRDIILYLCGVVRYSEYRSDIVEYLVLIGKPLESYVMAKRHPLGVVSWGKLERGLPAHVSSSSSDHCSKLRGSSKIALVLLGTLIYLI
ncbi:hypothetical protein AVEN_125183-1 [Araneus ventricosus]|uniref:Uncharacterized protein n=1 Tax=Araneus ventricosus TaxID=182803 RepID=A0A4Y2R5J9_ARAVE|nr:hypothetical protein AVEN_125183-1 [Araneus ventricosus]